MPKLCQVIATCDGIKNRVNDKLTKSHQALQKNELFNGHVKTYRPKDDDPASPLGEVLPPDTRPVIAKANEIIAETSASLTELFDVEFQREATNATAKADVVVDGTVLLTGVPVTYLLFLEKRLVDMVTFIKKLPTLDPGEKWTYDENQACYATAPSERERSKKITDFVEASPATKEHPAQIREVNRDIIAGYWSTIKYSTALPVARVQELLTRVEKLQVAVKYAREEANSVEVPPVTKPGATVFKYLFS